MNDVLKSYFLALCEEQNISKAAGKLYISRQSLSSGLKKLEDEIGVKLFVRKKEGLDLTEAGQKLKECILDMDSRWNLFLKQVQPSNDEAVRIGMTSVAFELRDFNSVYMIGKQVGVHIEIIDLQHEKYIDMMENNNLDIFYSSTPHESKKVSSCQLTDEEMVLLVSENHPLADREEIDFTSDIYDQTFLITEGERVEVYANAFAHTGSTYRLLPDNKSILQMQLLNNLGICWTTGSIADRFVAPGIIKKKLKNSPKVIQTYLVYRNDMSPKGFEVLDMMIGQWGHK